MYIQIKEGKCIQRLDLSLFLGRHYKVTIDVAEKNYTGFTYLLELLELN